MNGPGRGGLPVAAGLAAVAVSCALALAVFLAVPEGTEALVIQSSMLLASVLAGLACLWRMRRAADPLPWRLLAVAALFTSIGNGINVATRGLQRSDVPTLGIGEIPFFLGYLLLLAAFARLFPPRTRPGDIARRIVDALVIAAVLTAVAWIVLLRGFVGPEASMAEAFTLAAYPAIDLAMAAALLVFASEVGGAQRKRLLLMALGVLLFLVGDVGVAFLASRQVVDYGSPFGLGWTAGFLAFALAALARPATPDPPVVLAQNARLSVLLVYGPFLLVLPLVAVDFLNHRTLDPVLFLLGVLTVGSLAARQVLMSKELLASNRRLQASATEERTAKAALEQSEQRFRLAAAATQDVVWDWDLGQGTLVWGDSIEPAFGYRMEGPQVGLASWTDHVHPDDRDAVTGSLERAMAGGESTWKAEYRFQRADGSWATVLDRGAILRDGAGRVVRVVGAMADLSRVREAQARLAAKEAETGRLREQAAFKAQFLNNAAHELSTPLTPIKLQMASIRRGLFGDLGPEQAKAMDLLERNLDRLGLLVKDLLDAARLQSGHLGMAQRAIPLAGVVEDVVQSLGERAREQGVHLQALDLSPVARVAGDGARLHQVLLNLVHNALKFTPRGGRIEVRLAVEGDVAVLEVRDTGAGLSADQMTHLFQPFMQVHDTVASSLGGTGLGLYISRGIVEQHDGTLTCASEGPGKGAAFTVRLPLLRAAAPPAPAPPTVA
ncbi:MAG TPA: PAS domain-containing sensor histidine kinase [Candidatus Thermoplasmatota archaeon]|nr:PAS domain-containing sensor histidine kinase [Candidatus Thermoplasmatota archaeon]